MIPSSALPKSVRCGKAFLPAILIFLIALTLPAGAQVFFGTPAIRSSGFGGDITDSLKAGDSMPFVSGMITNQNNFGITIAYVIRIDGTIVASSNANVNANSVATVTTAANPVMIATAGAHTISFKDTSGVGPTRNFTVAAAANLAPTDLSLSTATVAENLPSGSTVGTFSTTAPNAGNTFTYSLVSGTGSTDNARFTIVGSSLRTAASFDYEANPSFSIRVRTTDQGGLSFTRIFAITVLDEEEGEFAIVELTGSRAAGFTLSWPSSPGFVYQVWFTESLATGGWMELGAPLAGSPMGLPLTYADTTTMTASVRYYRVERRPSP